MEKPTQSNEDKDTKTREAQRKLKVTIVCTLLWQAFVSYTLLFIFYYEQLVLG